MNVARYLIVGSALFVAGCGTDRTPTDPTSSAFSAARRDAATPARQVQATGHYDAVVDFSSLTLTPRGRNCLLEVDGTLYFSGTIEGTATAHTSALVFATC